MDQLAVRAHDDLLSQFTRDVPVPRPRRHRPAACSGATRGQPDPLATDQPPSLSVMGNAGPLAQ